MPNRSSKGCLQCRMRKVKCDEGRPSCRRCVQRGELCTGYRDETTLLFRDESEKTVRRALHRPASFSEATISDISEGSRSTKRSLGNDSRKASSQFTEIELPAEERSNQFPWARNVPEDLLPSSEDATVSRFFNKFVMYPCNHGSSPGFLEHLPSLFQEADEKGRIALRWAVRAASQASLAADMGSISLREQALQCYGRSLSELGEALTDPRKGPDDYTLMTVVILDIFESIYLDELGTKGQHAEGMAQILRLRGPNQIYSARGWSLFRLAHHRLIKEQLISRQPPLPESDCWLSALNDSLPDIRTEKDNFEIVKVCSRARDLLSDINNSPDTSPIELMSMIQEILSLDQETISWRTNRPEWSYNTISNIPRSNSNPETTTITAAAPLTSQFLSSSSSPPTDFLELHHDIWMTYEWNYHRTARILLHKRLLECLDRLLLSSISPADHHHQTNQQQSMMITEILSHKQNSIDIIRSLADQIFATVPQSLGDVDQRGRLVGAEDVVGKINASKCKGIGAYFLLWPIKILKSMSWATLDQRRFAEGVFERIRDFTGMKDALGDASRI